jgi:hypothetical protein
MWWFTTDSTGSLQGGNRSEVQVHHLISLNCLNNVIPIYLSGLWLRRCRHKESAGEVMRMPGFELENAVIALIATYPQMQWQKGWSFLQGMAIVVGDHV